MPGSLTTTTTVLDPLSLTTPIFTTTIVTPGPTLGTTITTTYTYPASTTAAPTTITVPVTITTITTTTNGAVVSSSSGTTTGQLVTTPNSTSLITATTPATSATDSPSASTSSTSTVTVISTTTTSKGEPSASTSETIPTPTPTKSTTSAGEPSTPDEHGETSQNGGGQSSSLGGGVGAAVAVVAAGVLIYFIRRHLHNVRDAEKRAAIKELRTVGIVPANRTQFEAAQLEMADYLHSFETGTDGGSLGLYGTTNPSKQERYEIIEARKEKLQEFLKKQQSKIARPGATKSQDQLSQKEFEILESWVDSFNKTAEIEDAMFAVTKAGFNDLYNLQERSGLQDPDDFLRSFAILGTSDVEMCEIFYDSIFQDKAAMLQAAELRAGIRNAAEIEAADALHDPYELKEVVVVPNDRIYEPTRAATMPDLTEVIVHHAPDGHQLPEGQKIISQHTVVDPRTKAARERAQEDGSHLPDYAPSAYHLEAEGQYTVPIAYDTLYEETQLAYEAAVPLDVQKRQKYAAYMDQMRLGLDVKIELSRAIFEHCKEQANLQVNANPVLKKARERFEKRKAELSAQRESLIARGAEKESEVVLEIDRQLQSRLITLSKTEKDEISDLAEFMIRAKLYAAEQGRADAVAEYFARQGREVRDHAVAQEEAAVLGTGEGNAFGMIDNPIGVGDRILPIDRVDETVIDFTYPQQKRRNAWDPILYNVGLDLDEDATDTQWPTHYTTGNTGKAQYYDSATKGAYQDKNDPMATYSLAQSVVVPSTTNEARHPGSTARPAAASQLDHSQKHGASRGGDDRPAPQLPRERGPYSPDSPKGSDA